MTIIKIISIVTNIDNMNEGASSKSIVIWVHPFGSFTMDDDCFKEMGELREWMNEGRIPRNNLLTLKRTILSILRLNLEKRLSKRKIGSPMQFTTTDYLFDLKIQSLYKKYIENNGDSDVVKPEHDIAKYILGEFVLSNMPWHTVDHILFPLCVDEKWVMTRLSFKDRLIYVYDSMSDAVFRANIHRSIDAYRFSIPLFLLILVLVDPFNVMMIKDLPSQEVADRGIYVALFAERFICGSNVVDNECDVNTHRIKFGSLLWKYGKMKLEKHITSESESSGIMKIMDRVKRYNN
ncbi:hypothetical protein H5410_051503 [Solanum commersonii]|uniref:Ubiquitin-like protease family profile domain-containing protein n=1 Tax=Solanum commersonii TaxID=4109 RepID=A0A9J5X0Q7_SOLCO|nr:hypothetical protein H5410_051503 [Solanum commersonii]